MSTSTNPKEDIAFSVVVMFLAVMTAAWFVYSMLFPQDVLTFLIMLVYFPIVGGIAVFLYRRLKMRSNIRADII